MTRRFLLAVLAQIVASQAIAQSPPRAATYISAEDCGEASPAPAGATSGGLTHDVQTETYIIISGGGPSGRALEAGYVHPAIRR